MVFLRCRFRARRLVAAGPASFHFTAPGSCAKILVPLESAAALPSAGDAAARSSRVPAAGSALPLVALGLFGLALLTYTSTVMQDQRLPPRRRRRWARASRPGPSSPCAGCTPTRPRRRRSPTRECRPGGSSRSPCALRSPCCRGAGPPPDASTRPASPRGGPRWSCGSRRGGRCGTRRGRARLARARLSPASRPWRSRSFSCSRSAPSFASTGSPRFRRIRAATTRRTS